MNKNQKTVCCLFLLTLFFCQPVYAGSSPLGKLTRGLTNILTAVGEYPVNFEKQVKDKGPVTGSVGMFIYGTYYTVLRVVAGVYEVGTFLIPIPKDYEPVIKPATLF